VTDRRAHAAIYLPPAQASRWAGRACSCGTLAFRLYEGGGGCQGGLGREPRAVRRFAGRGRVLPLVTSCSHGKRSPSSGQESFADLRLASWAVTPRTAASGPKPPSPRRVARPDWRPCRGEQGCSKNSIPKRRSAPARLTPNGSEMLRVPRWSGRFTGATAVIAAVTALAAASPATAGAAPADLGPALQGTHAAT
jgi:hypothetical protein